MLDQLTTRINESKFVQNARPRDWIILGGLIMFTFNMIFGITTIFLEVFEFFLDAVTFIIVSLILGEDRAWHVLELLETSPGSPDNLADISILSADLVFASVKAISSFAHGFWDTFEISFPVLADIDIDLDWLHVSLPQLSRAFFAFIQFIILYYAMRMIKRSIRKRINKRIARLDNDFFDKRFREVTVI